ncbi:TPA: hypothetical protein IAA87_11190 [Candidatus Avigastranaerophilus faecigallinarum]|nr:hypothetical protein [Candidatus Avigastranaerophilus faecigallinarum]
MHTEGEMSEIVNKYTSCMQEIKLRINAIHSIIKRQTTTLYPYTNLEFICLQIRKILELIAMANLVANKDEYQKIREKFSIDWNAKRIIETIEKVNKNFFPTAIYREQLDNEKIKYHWHKKVSNILTKDIYIKIYDEISNILHAQNPFKIDRINLDNLQQEALEYVNLIVNTLNEHNTYLCNGNIVNCNMNAFDPNSNEKEGKVSVHYFGQVTTDDIEEVLYE